ncbi:MULTISPECIES: GNAT family N-acetyltransferase [Lysinibacillus]|uniref:GNAT family N-acetyltransferase n=1 Tax=Lysinibacillus TaxID=400634 RepID=UPI00257D8320|nr:MULTISPECIES: GNAT family N-acetyltransferase [Lysinibacillus]
MNNSLKILRLTKADKSSFVTLMSQAFAQDPLFLHVFGNSLHNNEASSRVEVFVSFMFDKSFLLNEELWGVFENERLLGTYIVETPSSSKFQKVLGGLLVLGKLFSLLIQLPFKTLGLLNTYMRVTRASAPLYPHHYLIMIGVTPEAQGEGIGKALLHHLLANVRADSESQGVALDTENKGNVDLYRRFGFELNKEISFDELPVYCMNYKKEC